MARPEDATSLYRLFALGRALPFIGAVVSGIDLSRSLSDHVHVDLEVALAEQGAMLLRDQSMTPDQYLEWTEYSACIDVTAG
jgi:alpha-ketoglutarate-dependent taurine dioxygenase